MLLLSLTGLTVDIEGKEIGVTCSNYWRTFKCDFEDFKDVIREKFWTNAGSRNNIVYISLVFVYGFCINVR